MPNAESQDRGAPRRTTRRILDSGAKQCCLDIQQAPSLSSLAKVFENVLVTIGRTLFEATEPFLPRSDNLDFYFWPGYVRAIHSEMNRRLTLHYSHPDDQRDISCGIGYRSSVAGAYKESEAALWYDLVLNPNHEDHIFWCDESVGVFHPGGTHPWIMQRSSPPNLKEDSGYEDVPLDVLAIELGDRVENPVSKKNGILQIRLPAGPCEQWGPTIAGVLNDYRHLSPNLIAVADVLNGPARGNDAGPSGRYCWPHSLHPVAVPDDFGDTRREGSGQLGAIRPPVTL